MSLAIHVRSRRSYFPISDCASIQRLFSLFALSTLFWSPALALAQDVEQKSRLGNWSVYCVKDIKPAIATCSLATAAVADIDPGAWLKLGLAYTSPSGDLELTIRTPRLNYFKRGISIAADGRQLGRAFVDYCNTSLCQTTITVESRILQGLGTSENATFEYQTGEDDGVAIAISLAQFVPALAELRRTVGMEAAAIVTADNRSEWKVVNRLRTFINFVTFGKFKGDVETPFTVEVRSNPFSAHSYTYNVSGAGWGKPLYDCLGKEASKEVKVTSDLKVKDDRKLKEWLVASKSCPDDAVVWIIPKNKQANTPHDQAEADLERLSIYTLYDTVRDRVSKNVVIADPTGVPLKISERPLGLTSASSPP